MTEPGVRDGDRQIADAGWEDMRAYMPAVRPNPRGGRPRMPDRQAMEAILFVARTGCAWKRLPRRLGAPSTVHDRFQAWTAAGVFIRLWEAGLLDDAVLRGLHIIGKRR